MPFALGQRWMSDAESDLGLGTVIKLEDRMITLIFPATGDMRIFARNNAPLTRVIFNPKDEVQGPEDWFFVVDSVAENSDELMVYQGVRSDNGDAVTIPETLLHYNIRFNKPHERLFAGQIDRMNRFALRYQARLMAQDGQSSECLGMLGARVGLIPHQLWIAQQVGQRHAPRVLLADEVGLGKTIEAGMILHQQLLTGRAQRVLIVVPESLCHQWLIEMLRRFNLHFSLFDEARCVEAYADHDNPFETEQLILCSMDLLRKKRRFDQVLDAEWDLLVVDEAHHLEWSPDQPSRPYQVIEALANEVPGVLLLTATPDQLGHESHFARLRLLDPERFYDYEAFLKQEENYQELAQAANPLLHEQVLSEAELQALEPYLSPVQKQSLLQAQGETLCVAKQDVLQQLLDRHGTSRLLFRNTRQAIQGFPQRMFCPHPFAMPEQYNTALRVMQRMQTQTSLMKKIELTLYPERTYQAFDAGNTTWWNFDPRVGWLIDFLKQHRSKKVLIIASQADTALTLEEALRVREGIRATVFHENMSIVERDKAGAYFAQEEGGAQALICSEIGSEGRNFQFASDLVMFDLPLNPDVLEQRIGRLDRIGQQKDINIHLPYFQETSQATLMAWYHEGLNAFEKTCPTGQALHQQHEAMLLHALEQQAFDADALADVAAERQAMTQKLEQGRDKLLELNSHGGSQSQALVQKLKDMDSTSDFISFILDLWDIIGLDQEDKGENTLILRPGEQMLFSYPGIPDDGVTVTFDRDLALARDEVMLITPEHPLVATGLDLILGSDTGSTSVALIKNKAIPAGTVFLECMYVVDASAPRHTQVSRYLPATPIRVLLNQQGQDLSDRVDFKKFNQTLSPVNRHLGIKLVNASQSIVHPLLEKGLDFAKAQAEVIKSEANQRMQHALGEELQRLTALKEVNPAIRQVELDHLQQQQDATAHYIEQSQLQLDAIRLILVSHS